MSFPFGLQDEPKIRHDPKRPLDAQCDIVCDRMPASDNGVECRCSYRRMLRKIFHR